MKLAMIGAGYVGLTTGACLAHLGHSVTCIDNEEKKIRLLQSGSLPIFEPGLDKMVANGTENGLLGFSSDVAGSLKGVEAVFLAVGTPSRPGGAIDLSFVERAARQIAPALPRDCVVVLKSTVVAGTARRVREIIAEARGGLDFTVASNPEFLREGSAVADFLEPDRVVIGSDDRRAGKVLKEIYAPLIEKGVPAVVTTTVNAEMIKYAANAFLALKIGFINEVADLCEQLGGDAQAVAEGIGLDRRIGRAFLSPGPGFGGSCFPKDTRAFAAIGRKEGAPQMLVETLIERNDKRKLAIGRRILDELGTRPAGARVAVLGVAFKANTDDVRESAALTIIPQLQAKGCIVHAHDPEADAASALPEVVWHESPYTAVSDADIVVILTEWDDYRKLDLARVAAAMSGRTLFDCRNVLDAEAAGNAGLRYIAIGRKPSNEKSRAARRSGRAAAAAGGGRIVASPS